MKWVISKFAAVTLLWTASAQAEQRVALVIGNSKYQTVSPLKNPRADAVLMRNVLRKAGFKVTMVRDANYQQMRKAIVDFGEALKTGAVGLFYYFGHGIQFDGANYMVPVDAKRSDKVMRKLSPLT